MKLRQFAKKVVHSTGLFPQVRALKRRLDRSARNDLARDLRLYAQFIRPGDLVFDIGVNLGQKATVFLACGARVVGAEPNPLCFATIRREVRGKDFTLVPKAAGAASGSMMLNIVGTESTASLRADWRALHDHGSPSQVPVEVTTLDTLIGEFGVPSFCKIDVEGFELQVLRGLSRPLAMVTFEYHAEERDQLLLCLERLDDLASIRINLIRLNEERFELPEWLSLPQFQAWLDGGRLPPAGDCFVASAP